MSDTQTHLVGRQVIELHLDQKEGAFDIQDRVGKLFVSDINPALDEACSGLVGPDEFIQIDKLEIELGLVDVDRIERDFAPLVRRHLRENLSGRVGLLRHEKAHAAKIKKTDRAIGGWPPDESGRFDDRKISEAGYQLGLLQFFLQTGNLPWYQQTLTPFAPENVLSFLLQKAPQKLKALLDEGLRHPGSGQRLVYQFSDDWLSQIVELLAPGRKEEIQDWLNDLATIGKIVDGIDMARAENRLSFWDTLISGLKDPARRNLSDADMNQLLLAAITSNYPGSLEARLHALHGAVDRLSQTGIKLVSRLAEIIERQIQKLDAHGPPGRDENQSDQPAERSKDLGRLNPKMPDTVWLPHRGGMAPDSETPFARAGQRAADEKIADRIHPEASMALQAVYVKNAGLVLLWPYFNNLFKQFNLLNQTGFVDDAAAARAVHLLQYLATGKQQAAEFELPLNKLLCGWDLQAPLNKFIRITTEEQAECRNLLTAAIAHWKALKKTSIESFRDSFLTRNGRLQKKENGWHLTIESRAYDLLLERLPWGISLIKLSWMPDLLTVEWHPKSNFAG